MKPEITVVVPYYNESKSIEMTLSLIADQTLKPRMAILVNSSSTDNCSEIVDLWIEKYQGPIGFLNIYQSTNTPSSSKNAGIKLATTPWIALMDCGQIFPKTWLESQWSFVMDNPGFDWVSGVCHFMGEGIIDECAVAHTYGYNRKRPTMPTSLIKKELFDKYGLFLENRRAGYDMAWPLLLSHNGIKRGINQDVVMRYENVNFGSTLAGIFKKSFYYNLPTVDMPHYYVPYYYLILLVSEVFVFLIFPKFGIFLALILLLIRSYILSGVKSNNFLLLNKNFRYWIFLPVVAVAIDSGRICGILKGIWKYHLSHIFE